MQLARNVPILVETIASSSSTLPAVARLQEPTQLIGLKLDWLARQGHRIIPV